MAVDGGAGNGAGGRGKMAAGGEAGVRRDGGAGGAGRGRDGADRAASWGNGEAGERRRRMEGSERLL